MSHEANPERGELALDVNGQTYTLRMRLNALCALQKRMGKSYGEIFASISMQDVEAIREMFFAYLQPYHSKQFKTQEQVGDLIDEMGGHVVAIGVITDLYKLNRPKKDVKPEGSANPPTAGTGLDLSETGLASASLQ
jgi:hypothetical protein